MCISRKDIDKYSDRDFLINIIKEKGLVRKEAGSRECLQTQGMEKFYISYVVIMVISVIIGIYIAKHNGK